MTSQQTYWEVIKLAEDRMYRNKLAESISERNNIIALIKNTLVEKSFETEEHCTRMKERATQMGNRLGLSQSLIDDLILLALLHDVGKIAIDERILLKPDKLTNEEWEIVKKHPEVGYRIALTTPELVVIAEAILVHHERWDGMGYPRGLKGNEIPLLSRIISIIDAYDTMAYGRPYKKAVSHKKALDEIKKNSGTQFDPTLVDIFINIL
jgi:HD-GYP domain-containing protein (c-di-GMP phosphodiesterase class II)